MLRDSGKSRFIALIGFPSQCSPRIFLIVSAICSTRDNRYGWISQTRRPPGNPGRSMLPDCATPIARWTDPQKKAPQRSFSAAEPKVQHDESGRNRPMAIYGNPSADRVRLLGGDVGRLTRVLAKRLTASSVPVLQNSRTENLLIRWSELASIIRQKIRKTEQFVRFRQKWSPPPAMSGDLKTD